MDRIKHSGEYNEVCVERFFLRPPQTLPLPQPPLHGFTHRCLDDSTFFNSLAILLPHLLISVNCKIHISLYKIQALNFLYNPSGGLLRSRTFCVGHSSVSGGEWAFQLPGGGERWWGLLWKSRGVTVALWMVLPYGISFCLKDLNTQCLRHRFV